jgi:hypothetical protein
MSLPPETVATLKSLSAREGRPMMWRIVVDAIDAYAAPGATGPIPPR